MLGNLYNKIYDYRLFICDFKKTIIEEIVYSNIEYNPRFDDFNELEFSIHYYQNNILRLKDKNFDLTKANYIIKMEIFNGDTLVKEEFFTIDNPSSNMASEGIFTKSVHCYSLPYTTFQMRRLRGYIDQVRTLYDPNHSYDFNDNTKGGILNLLSYYLYGSWTVGYCNSKYINVYKTFSFSDSTYIDVIRELEKQFGCYILFNSVNNTINIYAPEELNTISDLVISKENYLKSMNVNIEYTGQRSRIKVFGKNNISINKYTIDGESFVQDYTPFLDEMSNSLRASMNTWLALRESNKGTFEGYVNQLDVLDASLLTKKNELAVLKQELAVIQANMDSEKKNSNSTTATYTSLLSQQTAKQAQITSKNAEITSVNNQITAVNSNISALNILLKMENNFTQEQLVELSDNFIKEDTLTLSSCTNEKQLYDYSVAYIAEKSKLPITIEIDMIDIFSDIQSQDIWNKLNLGDFVYVDVNELGYDYELLRIVSYKHNKSNNTLSISLSNNNELNINLITLNNIFKTTTQTSSTVVVNQDNYASYGNDKSNILYQTSIINTTTTNILSNGIEITQRGFIGTDIGSNGVLQYLSDKIIISSDNMQTYHTLLSGSGLYLEDVNKKTRTVLFSNLGSFQIDKNVGTSSSPIWNNTAYIDGDGDLVLAGKASIGSGNSIFKADTNGIYLGNAIFSSAPFRVTSAGVLYATSANITGTITGSTITGSNILGGKFYNTHQTGWLEINENGIDNIADFTFGVSTLPSSYLVKLYNNVTNCSWLSIGNEFLITSGSSATPKGTWDFSNATVRGLGTTGIYTDSNGHGIQVMEGRVISIF